MEAQQQQQQWIVVKSRKKKHIQKMVKPEKIYVKGGNTIYEKEVNIGLEEQFLNNFNTQHNKKAIATLIDRLGFNKIQVICLGIGNFLSYLKPQLQMLFLKHCILKPFQQSRREIQINIYDPVFSNQQQTEIINLKGQCKQFQSFEQETSFILYMPHCDRFLYEKVCEQKLKKPNCEVFVIGNSINQYKQRCLITNEAVPEVFKSFTPHDVKIRDFKQAFNDTFIYTL